MQAPEEQRPHPAIPRLLFLTAAYGVGFVAWLGTARGLPGWYPALAKPAWTPPPWLFAPVWTVLYGLMGTAAWLVWRSERPGRALALGLFAAQLALNGLWSWLFFAWNRLPWASYEIALLLLAVLATTWAFARVRSTSGLLMLPYVAWLLYATPLCFAIWRLNR